MTTQRRLVSRFARSGAVPLLAALLACGGPQPPPPQPTTGTISGALSVAATSAADGGRATVPTGFAALSPARSAVSAADLVPGEVLVRFEDGVRASAITTLEVAGLRLQAVRPLALPNATLFRAAADRDATLALVAALRARSDVRYAEPNWILRSQRVPNDPLYPSQWHYPAIALPAAWDRETGSAAVVVGVVDTGILYAGDASPATHPDLTGRVLGGYDFVSDPTTAGDGDGRDANPYDVGDDPHGTHVAGTIGAASDNGVGVAGVDWAARLLPVRVLGVGGAGALDDIVDGILWAAGFAVPGVPANANPAHVLNLSLGGEFPCPASLQDAFGLIATASPRDAVVVVAAGNAGDDVGFSAPANCANVIAVGATDARGHRAPYSNHGTRIDVMAPGGDLTADHDGDGQPDGVLSLSRDGTGAFGYAFAQGTSMAAPHVAGVIALMKSIDPALSRTQALAALAETARPLDAAACRRPTGGECGAGLIDAAAALAAVADGAVLTPGGGAIAYDPNPADYGASIVERDIRLTNTGDATIDWFIAEYDEDASNPGLVPEGALFVNPASGSLAPGASSTMRLRLERSVLPAPGAYRVYLVFLVDGVEQPLTLRFRTAAAAALPTGPTRIVAVDEHDVDVVGGARSYASFVPSYTVSAEPGRYVVLAWTDENGDGRLDDGDFFGVHPVPVSVAAGQTVAGVDIALAPVWSLGDERAALRERLRSRAPTAAWPDAPPAGGDAPPAP